MLKKIFAFILVSYTFLLGEMVSDIYGYINSDTTWQDIVEVIGDIVIGEGVTLIIKPGTVVKFSADTSVWDDRKGFKNRCDIIVYGNLKLSGTSKDNITFTSTEDKAGSWGGIKWISTKSSPLKNIIEYVSLSYGTEGFHFDSTGTTIIRNCKIQNLKSRYWDWGGGNSFGIKWKGDSLIIEECIISNIQGCGEEEAQNYGDGGNGFGIWSKGEYLKIENTSITDIRGGDAYGYCDPPEGVACDGGDAFAIYCDSSFSFLAFNNLISDCKGGLGDGCYCTHWGIYWGKDGNGYGIYIGKSTKSEVRYNLIKSSSYGIKAEKIYSSLIISSNQIFQNTSGVEIPKGKVGGSLFEANDFCENSTNLRNWSENDTVEASCNYWGSVNEEEILCKFYGNIKFIPWTDSSHTKTYYPKSVCGYIKKDTTWQKEVIVRGDVIVPEGITLKIESGTKVKFLSHSLWEKDTDLRERTCEFAIYGKLKAIGSISDSIEFAPLKEEWGGSILLHNDSDDTLMYAKIQKASWGIVCMYSSPFISHSKIENVGIGIYCNSASPQILNNEINQCATGITCLNYSAPSIIGNLISGCTGADAKELEFGGWDGVGIECDKFSSPLIKNNKIYGCKGGDGLHTGGDGIGICAPSKGMRIENNEIFHIYGGEGGYSSGSGISIRCGPDALVSGNIIGDFGKGGWFFDDPEAKGVGILCGANSKIYGNTIKLGELGWRMSAAIECGGRTVIGGSKENSNKFIWTLVRKWEKDSVYLVKNISPDTVIATYNDWGTYTSDSISMFIFDHYDDPKYGYVIFDTTQQDTPKPKPMPDSFAFYSTSPAIAVCDIFYSLPKPASVSIKIFDITGREVWSIFNPELAGGYYRIHWFGKERGGRKLPAGIYFIVFKAVSTEEEKEIKSIYSKTQKVILLR